jgi:hypothetical protein
VESAAELILKARRWPDFYDYQQQLDTWREVRADFADGVEAWEWALVDRAYAHLLRTSLIARPGEPCTPGHLDVITEMRQRAVRARAVVLERSASQRALEHLVKVLGPGPEETTK